MIQGQIHQDKKNLLATRASFSTGVKACPKEPTLWILASQLDEANGKSIKAWALLEKARLVNLQTNIYWR
jgi:pre-mRNA-processing factor 6